MQPQRVGLIRLRVMLRLLGSRLAGSLDRQVVGYTLIGAGIVVGVLAGVGVYYQVNEAQALIQSQPRAWVPIAANPVEAREVIRRADVSLVQLPEAAVPNKEASYLPPPGASDAEIEAGKQALLAQVVDKFTPQRVVKGEVLNPQELGRESVRNTPSYTLPPGKVAYPFPVNVRGGNPANERVIIAFLNAVRPGDFVDVYFSGLEIPEGLSPQQEERARGVDAARYLVTRLILQNLKVINVGFFPDATGQVGETSKDDRYLTFEVTRDEMLTLKWLKDVTTFTGNIELVLRSSLDTRTVPQGSVNFDSISRQFGIGTAPPRTPLVPPAPVIEFPPGVRPPGTE